MARDTNAVCRFNLSIIIINRDAQEAQKGRPSIQLLHHITVTYPLHYHDPPARPSRRSQPSSSSSLAPFSSSDDPTTFCATRLLSRCFRRLRSLSFPQGMVEKRGCAVCGGRANSSAAYHEVGADGGPSRVVSITIHMSRQCHETKRRFCSCVKIWADIDVFQRYPTHGQLYTLCALVCHGICLPYALSCSYTIIPSFPGDFF